MPTLSHKIRLYPNKKQEKFFAQSCGCSRFVYNWALDTWQKEYEAGLKPSNFGIQAKLPGLKAQNPWLKDVSNASLQHQVQNLFGAFQKFFKKQTKYPKFHKKGRKDSFYLRNDTIKIENKKLKIPKVGSINLSQELRFKGKIMGCVISRTADKWFASISVELSELPREIQETDKIIGLDLGINSAIATSDGDFYKAPKPLKKLESKLKRQNQSVSRKQKGSNNRKKAIIKLSKIHAKVANIRKDWLNKATTKLIDENQVICLEDLNVKGMMKSNVAKSLSDVALGEIRRQFQYKAALHGREIRFVNRFYPSSKTCSNCGCVKQDLKRGDEVYNCVDCGFVLNRDLNAAINIRNCAIPVQKIPKDIRESAAKPRKLEETQKFESLIQESLVDEQ